ncbi:hypothetical protein Ssi03_21260 [Sphaerisporangium siamense]|uniref:DUF397 domain-containing protein n=1 Tax=Sphaerisporangium siamense TaxID=795645 RepID=A0A7W7GCF2_9ACTN|nr:DUF397 domain-containing protein [Sphaerisporangium siamense]MBB4701951.1 hypothetical protein [Sphaerisporangium siamense]GII84136.1 hypothetical protein Ssi03_21260 [Sphaerisporangium siamense]
MSAAQSRDLQWFKAKASTSGNGCVEVAHLPDGGVAVRNSRTPDEPVIRFTAFEWDCFLDGARKGEFDLPTV